MSWLTRFLCSHAHSWRERDTDGVLWFVCHGCDRRVPAIHRTDDERAEMMETYRLPLPPVATKAKPVRKLRHVAVFAKKGTR